MKPDQLSMLLISGDICEKSDVFKTTFYERIPVQIGEIQQKTYLPILR